MNLFGKGFLKNTHFVVQVLFLFSMVLLGMAIGDYLFIGFVFVKNGFSLDESMNDLLMHINENPHVFREYLFFQTTCSFLIPSIFFARFFSDNTREYLHTEEGISGSVMGLTVLSMIFILPFINTMVYWTQQIPVPEFMTAIVAKFAEWEKQTEHLMGMLLKTDKYSTFLMNLLIVAVLAAVGEEFLFRGVLQNIFSKIIKNQHAVIWVVAFIFSLIHFQFYGFFARMFLGAYFGYLLYYSKSIWVPVLAHFTNNAIGVISCYSIKDPKMLKDFDEVGSGSSAWIGLLSLALFSITVILLIRKCKSEHLSS